MRFCRSACFLFISMSGLFFLLPVASAQETMFDVPDGFNVSLYADDELAHDIHCMTVDSLGRIVVCLLYTSPSPRD